MCPNTVLFLGARASSPPKRNPAGKMPALPGEASAGSEGVPALAEGKMPSLPPDNSQMRLPCKLRGNDPLGHHTGFY